MSESEIRSESRRQFLKFLSGSPLLAYSGLGTIARRSHRAAAAFRSDPLAPLRTRTSSVTARRSTCSISSR